jgi:hypothetical protein
MIGTGTTFSARVQSVQDAGGGVEAPAASRLAALENT